MAKFYGNIGFGKDVEIRPGVYENQIISRPYIGDVIRYIKRKVNGESINSTIDGLRFNNQISIVSDDFAFNNLYNMVYIEWMGSKFKVESVTVDYPRLIIELGGVYHEQESNS